MSEWSTDEGEDTIRMQTEAVQRRPLLVPRQPVYSASCCQNLCLQCTLTRPAQCRRLHASDSESDDDVVVDRMKQKIAFHLMNPFQKWSYRPKRRFPWKLLLQVLNVVLITAQLITYASYKYVLMDFVTLNKQTFVQLFILKPSVGYSVYEPESNPPVTTIFTFDELFQQLSYTAKRYHTIGTLAVAPYGHGWEGHNSKAPQTVKLLVTHYAQGTIDSFRKKYSIHGDRVTDAYYLGDTTLHGLDQFLNTTQLRAQFNRVLDLRMYFDVSTVYLEGNNPDCVLFNIEIVITNDFHRGNMPVQMNIDTDISMCNSDTITAVPDTGIYVNKGIVSLDIFVILSAFLSTVICGRSLIKTFYFQKEVRTFFRCHYKRDIGTKETLSLFNLWLVGVIISNVLAILGSMMKIILSYVPSISTIELSDITSIIIGLATFGQILGCLRFLSYIDKYNMLIITVQLALPSVLRFIVCAGVLYVAFVLIGWLVLGPYHTKFRNIYVTSESLFSLINGDDMFTSFDGMSSASSVAYGFSKIYIYIFVCMFIYVVLSVFISLIKDTYDTLHEQWAVRSRGFFQDFITGKLDSFGKLGSIFATELTTSSDELPISLSPQAASNITTTSL